MRCRGALPRGNTADTATGANRTPAAQVAALDAKGFFSRLADALPDNPPTPADPHALTILSDLGVTPGEPVKLPSASAAIAAGLADGHERVATAPSNLLTGNGWSWFGDDVGNYGPDYALRSYAASAQLGIGTRDDEVRAVVTQDSDSHPLNGANRYVIHFAPNQLPPVRGFLVDHRLHQRRRTGRQRAGASRGRRPQWRAPQSRRLARRDRVVHARAQR